MGGFFQQLAKTLADRWISLLVLPGAFFLGGVWLSVSLGHADAWNVALLTRQAENAATTIADLPTGAQALLVVAVLAAAAGTGFVVQALAGVTRRVWLGQWPRPSARSRRRGRPAGERTGTGSSRSAGHSNARARAHAPANSRTRSTPWPTASPGWPWLNRAGRPGWATASTPWSRSRTTATDST
ncbi:hypothetical protein ACFQ0G_47505 [Streptomyces chiangmaiensis]